MTPVDNIRTLTSEELTHRIHEAGVERSKAEGAHVYAVEFRKILLEELTLEIIEKEGVSHAKAKSMARTHADFRQSVDALVEATEAKFMVYANYKEVDIEIRRRLNLSFAKNREYSAGKLTT